MNSKDYQNARNLSWEILIQERITELPAPIVALCQNLGIVVKYYDLTNGNDGECTIVEEIPYILVSKNCSAQRKRFTIAQNLGTFYSVMWENTV